MPVPASPGGFPAGPRPSPIVLASGSPTRRAMLQAVGLTVEAVAPAVDEEGMREALFAEGADALEAATVLAETKARRVAARRPPETLVLGADQLLVHQGRWLAKPADRNAARAQLLGLSGGAHELATAVVAVVGGERVWHHAEAARLRLRPLSEAFVEAYLDAAGDAVLGSVGAYHMEGLGAHLFARVEGDPYVIQGLPLLPLLAYLRDRGVVPA